MHRSLVPLSFSTLFADLCVRCCLFSLKGPTMSEPTKMWSGRFREPHSTRLRSLAAVLSLRRSPAPLRDSPPRKPRADPTRIAAAGILTSDELTAMLAALDQQVRSRSPFRKATPSPTPTSSREAYRTHMPGTRDDSASPPLPPWSSSTPTPKTSTTSSSSSSTKLVGPLALKLHTGRSRNEQIATDMRLFVRESIDAILTGLNAWALALVEPWPKPTGRRSHAQLHAPPAR